MNELIITASGWVATEVRLFKGQGDLAIASFRVASTPRYFDRDKGAWVDGVTEWFTVRAFRGAAITVAASIKKGMPVVVTGRLRTSTWEAKDGTRVDHIIDATALGPDCTRGFVTGFSRATGDASMTESDMSAGGEAIAASRAADGAGMDGPPQQDDEPPSFDAEPAADAGERERSFEEEPEPVA
ncbi:single-stranded DNA-binding protein [Demequina soli]|uniref:single-stranded DNA-binding protein n=1 Tax=Demequina soli TaxID=1638987 RepID=UPI000782CB94|nr:single-stranded DNA-binding protein [Demequina soli]